MKNQIKISRDELDILYLPKRLSAVEVAKKIRLPLKANFSDKIDLDLTPYLILPVSLIGKNKHEWLYVIKPTQSGGTVFLQIAVADAIDQDPGTLIYITPDEVLSKKGMQEKVINMIDETPELKKHKTGIKTTSKTGIHLDVMSIYPGWAGSLGTLSSIPAKRVVLDEVRLMKLQIGVESNAIKLANDRLTTYKNMGLAQGYAVSTPSVEGDLLHQQLSIPGTLVLKWHIKCENCGHAAVLDFFENIKLVVISTDKEGKEKKEPKCVCTKCGHYFEDADQKRKINANGFYAPDDGSLKLPQNFETAKRIIFWYSSLDSPFRSFKAIWEEFMDTKDKLHDYKNFWQCWLARFWIDDVSKTNIEDLEKQKHEIEGKGVVPTWTKVITGGIDTQDSGFYVTVRAWGANLRTRLIDAFFIECKIKITNADDIHLLIKRDVEDRIYTTINGEKWQIGLYAIDTGGHRTKEIYDGTRDLERIIWVKGAKEGQNITIKYSKDYNLYLVRTVEYLDETEEKSFREDFELPKNIQNDYLRQFINIRKRREKIKKTNEDIVVWVKVGQYDYRMADVHAFICLDIPTSIGTFRREINKEEFIFNPLIKKIEEASEAEAIHEEDVEGIKDRGTYEIGDINWDN